MKKPTKEDIESSKEQARALISYYDNQGKSNIDQVGNNQSPYSSPDTKASDNNNYTYPDCANCGHPASMHSDGEYVCTGECYMDIGSSEPAFCICRKYEKSKATHKKGEENGQ